MTFAPLTVRLSKNIVEAVLEASGDHEARYGWNEFVEHALRVALRERNGPPPALEHFAELPHCDIYTGAERGWMRRPDLDKPGIDTWEQPDGSLYAAPKGSTPNIFVMRSVFPPSGLH